MSQVSDFGSAIYDYAGIGLFTGIVVAVGLTFLALFVSSSLQMINALQANVQLVALSSVFLGIAAKFIYNIRSESGRDLNTGLEVFAALTPLAITPILAVILGLILSYFG